MNPCSVGQQQGRWSEGEGRRGNKPWGPKGCKGCRNVGWGGLRVKAQVLDVGDQPGSTMAEQSPGHRGVQIEVGCNGGAYGHRAHMAESRDNQQDEG